MYVEGYEMPDYTPNEHERALIMDAVQGLLAEPEFLRAVHAWYAAAVYAVE